MDGAILSHLSGSTRKGETHLAFHWVVSSDFCDCDFYTHYDPVDCEESTDPVPRAVETTNPDSDQTTDYINPDELDQTSDYIDPDNLYDDQTSDYINPNDL